MVSDLEKAETSSSARLRPEYAYSWQGQAYQGGGEEAKQAAQAASAVQGLGALEVRWFIQASRIARISSSQLELLVNQDDFLLLGSVSCPWDGLSEGGWQICGKSQKLEAIIMNKWEDVGNKPSVSPTATPFFTSALKGYLQVCPRKQARAALALQCESANIERLSEPRCGRTMEHVFFYVKRKDVISPTVFQMTLALRDMNKVHWKALLDTVKSTPIRRPFQGP
ncbi:hypothetical protein MJT46_016373 [Ovis ammon polii x Ovis aries]|nr:hypothetical protein MJT46_016373 [Ovis ammon polii x Ovis aries]